MIGGGATPDQQLPTVLIAVISRDHSAAAVEEKLRTAKRAAPVIARIENDRVCSRPAHRFARRRKLTRCRLSPPRWPKPRAAKRASSRPVDRAGHAPRSKPVVDVHHAHIGSAAIQHPQQRRQPAEA